MRACFARQRCSARVRSSRSRLDAGAKPRQLGQVGGERLRLDPQIRQHGAGEDRAADGRQRVFRPRQDRRRRRAAHPLQRHQDLRHHVLRRWQGVADAVLAGIATRRAALRSPRFRLSRPRSRCGRWRSDRRSAWRGPAPAPRSPPRSAFCRRSDTSMRAADFLQLGLARGLARRRRCFVGSVGRLRPPSARSVSDAPGRGDAGRDENGREPPRSGRTG